MGDTQPYAFEYVQTQSNKPFTGAGGDLETLYAFFMKREKS